MGGNVIGGDNKEKRKEVLTDATSANDLAEGLVTAFGKTPGDFMLLPPQTIEQVASLLGKMKL